MYFEQTHLTAEPSKYFKGVLNTLSLLLVMKGVILGKQGILKNHLFYHNGIYKNI